MKKQKKSNHLPQIAGMALGFLCGIIGGIAIAESMPQGMTDGEFDLRLGITLLLLLVAIFFQTIVHEGGHLVFGLISGYRFTSFRIGSIQLSRRAGKFTVSRYSLAGTGGQCLMDPPERENGEIPVTLYNLGGSMMNLIVSLLFFLIWLGMDHSTFLATFFILLVGTGVVFALMNGIPMRLGTVDNDGYNAFALRKDRIARDAFALQLRVNARIAEGMRIHEMPENWFELPADEDMRNSMVAAKGLLVCSRLIDEHRYAQAGELATHYLEIPTGFAGIHRNMLVCEKICCTLLTQDSYGQIDTLCTKELRAFWKSMKNSPSIIRTQYIYALLAENDSDKAEKHRKHFEKVEKTYPYPNDMLADREMMDAALTKRSAMENGKN